MVVPYQGPSSDYVVVKMIPDSRLPPRHLHVVHTGKTSAVIKWESPYDSPDQDLVRGAGVQPAIPFLGMVGDGPEGAVTRHESWAWPWELSRRSHRSICVPKDAVLRGASSESSLLHDI